jgi:small subunit ribosomal protein S20
MPVMQRGALQVVAAEEGDKKKVQKRTPYPVKRAQLAEERRMVNKSRKSACATRIKKVSTGW